LTKSLDDKQPREQAGFRKGYSTIHDLHSVNQLIEKSDEYKIPLAMAFVDYQKAFDSVDIHKVLESIKNQGVVYVNILNYIYQNGTSFIRLHRDSNPFPLQKGVRQGDTISPKLFTACLESVFQNLDWETKGIKIDGEYLSHLRFANDIVLVANNLQDLQQMLNELNNESKRVGLKMILMTKLMHARQNDENFEVKVENDSVGVVDHSIYLGQRVTTDSSKEQEIKRRITLG